jgi:chondroitin-sulfate-ABC endolyase/exolyase
MLKKFILSCFFALLCSTQSKAQLTEINNIKTKYVNWLTGENVNYSNTYVKRRYDRIKRVNNANLGGTKDLSAYNFITPGAVWDFTDDDQSAEFADLTQDHLIRFVYIYTIKGTISNPNSAYHRESLRDTILTIFKYIKDKGVNSNTNFAYTTAAGPEDVVTSHYGISLNSSAYATAILLMKDDLKTAGEFNHHMGALDKLTYFVGPNYLPSVPTYPSNPGMNSDIVRSAMQQRLCYILAQEDTDNDKLANMIFFKKYADNALMIGNGWNDFIKPDFTTYHHRGVYANSYGLEALHQCSIINLMLKGSGYELNTLAQSNLKASIMAYRNFSTDLTMPLGITGRFPTNDTYDDLRPAFANLYTADPVANEDAGREFIRLWNLSALVTTPNLNIRLQEGNLVTITLVHSLGGMQDMANLLASSLAPSTAVSTEHFNFPYAGLSVHKYNGYTVSAKGTSKIIWDYEAAATENLYGQYGSAGAIEILTTGAPKTHASNGLNVVGLDWAHIPGTTVANLPFSAMATNLATNRQMNKKSFLAQASLDGDGVFSMDYEDYASATGNNPKSTALKTNFFFKDKILCLGSNIKGVNPTYPIHTTLFQTAFNSGNTSIFNGATVSGNNYSNTSSAGTTWWATDALGNGFVVPQNSYNTNAVTLERSSQTTPLHNNGGNGTGDFAKAYINHGVAPTAAAYQYAIWLQGNTATQDLATNFANYFEVIKQDVQAHAAKYIPDGIYAYSIFDPNFNFSNDVVKKTDKPAVVMTQALNSDNNLKLSLTNPNLGLLASNENPTWGQISQTPSILNRVPQADVVKLTLAGKWALVVPTNGITANIIGSDTEVSFSTINGLTIQTELIKADVLAFGFLNEEITTDVSCHAQLSWNFDTEGKQLANFNIEKSDDGKIWQNVTSLPATARNYSADTKGGYYRILATTSNNDQAYSKVLASNKKGCTINPQLMAYPNPTNGKVEINIKLTDTRKLEVFDLLGKNLTNNANIQRGTEAATLDLSAFSSGIYLIKTDKAMMKVLKK